MSITYVDNRWCCLLGWVVSIVINITKVTSQTAPWNKAFGDYKTFSILYNKVHSI